MGGLLDDPVAMTTMTGTTDVDDHAAAATTGTGPAARHTNGTAAAAHTVPESTDKGLGDSPGEGPAPTLGHRAPGQTLQLRPNSRRNHGTDTHVLTRGQPPGPAHDPAPGPAGNLEAVSGNRSFLT